MGDIGIKVSKKGNNVLTSVVKNEVFNSGSYMEQISEVVKVDHSSSINHPHGLRYTPIALSYITTNLPLNNQVSGEQADNYAITIADSSTGGTILYILFQATT